VVITKIEPLSPADRAGLSIGDVVTSVQNQPVSNIGDFKAALAHQDLSQGVRLEIVSATEGGPVRRYAFIQVE
jgi:S1-C subfamily serine protease